MRGAEDRTAKKRRARHFGLEAEWFAALWLRGKFYRILARNVVVPGGEIDLVAKRGATVIFVEVKARPQLEDAQSAITPTKQRAMRHAIRLWLSRNPWASSCTLRADAIYLAKGRLPQHVEHIFELPDI
ncbi:YraN family protein [Methylovirgula sp. 4M-Z18]|nr:YraN family protein [Methylovirgula sp. 4M-Z18]